MEVVEVPPPPPPQPGYIVAQAVARASPTPFYPALSRTFLPTSRLGGGGGGGLNTSPPHNPHRLARENVIPLNYGRYLLHETYSANLLHGYSKDVPVPQYVLTPSKPQEIYVILIRAHSQSTLI